jgi:hypothetical protein
MIATTLNISRKSQSELSLDANSKANGDATTSACFSLGIARPPSVRHRNIFRPKNNKTPELFS